MKTRIHLRASQAGFSLIEATLASSIAALALTTLLGIIPESLKNIREAGNIAAETNITQYILGRLSHARWQDASGSEDLLARHSDGQRFYFDDQGIAIEEEEPGFSLAFVAELKVPARDVTLPAEGSAEADTMAEADPYLRRVTVKIANVSNKDFDFQKALPIAYQSRSTLIARTGR